THLTKRFDGTADIYYANYSQKGDKIYAFTYDKDTLRISSDGGYSFTEKYPFKYSTLSYFLDFDSANLLGLLQPTSTPASGGRLIYSNNGGKTWNNKTITNQQDTAFIHNSPQYLVIF